MIDMGPPAPKEAAHDGSATIRVQALLRVLARPTGPRGPPAAPHLGGGRLLLRAAALPPVLQPHRAAIGRPGRPLQAAADRLPLRHYLGATAGPRGAASPRLPLVPRLDRKSTRLNSSHRCSSYA